MHRPTPRLRGRRAVEQRKRRLSQEPLCRDCKAKGVTRVADVIDHIIPLAQGGSDQDSNTRPLCHEHHKARTAEQFGHRVKQEIGLDGWPVGEGVV